MKKKYFLILFFILISLLNAQTKKTRIAVGTFFHETCTFCPDPTGIKEWEFYGQPERGKDVLNNNPYIRGFVHEIRNYNNIELNGIYSPGRAKGGSSGSWITKKAFDKYSYGMAEDIKKTGPYDGIYLALHGAMAVTGIDHPEVEIVRRIRKVTGSIPIFVTLDLHANEDHHISDAADAVFIVKRYPHYDSGRQGRRAARLLLRTISGKYKPYMVSRKPGIITPSVFQWTGEAPAMEIMERARRWEDRVKDVFVSVAFGFAYADVPDVGATVMVITNNDPELANKIADDMNEFIWRVRQTFAGKKLPKTKEGVRIAIEAAENKRTPIVIADHADRTGNSTHILSELIAQRASNFCVATISDFKAVNKLVKKNKVGDNVSINVGGYQDQYAGKPVKINGILTYLGKYKKFKTVAVIKFGNNNHIIITPVLHQVITTQIYKPLGINIDDVDIFVLKTRVHFRRGYFENGFARTIVLIDAPGLGPADLSKVPYKNIPKNVYPLSKQVRHTQSKFKIISEIESDRNSPFYIDLEKYTKKRKNLPIGVFDSGTGGLAVLNSILELDLFNNKTKKNGADGISDFFSERFTYLADEANMPYGKYGGEGKADFLRELIIKDVRFLLDKDYYRSPTDTRAGMSKDPVKVIVIACNTATAFGFETLRKALKEWELDIAVIGIVEAGAKSAIAKLTDKDKNRTIGVLATEGTCATDGYKRSINIKYKDRFNNDDIGVIQQAGIGLASAIDGDQNYILPDATNVRDKNLYYGPGISNLKYPIKIELLKAYNFDSGNSLLTKKNSAGKISEIQLNSVNNYIKYCVTHLIDTASKKYPDRIIDSVILGCTHYPFFDKQIRKHLLFLKQFKPEYNKIIPDDILLIDPSRALAVELYKYLKTNDLMGKNNNKNSEFYISVPNPELSSNIIDDNGEFPYKYKYGRFINKSKLYVKRVPFSTEWIKKEIFQRIKQSIPKTYKIIDIDN